MAVLFLDTDRQVGTVVIKTAVQLVLSQFKNFLTYGELNKVYPVYAYIK